MLGTLIKAHPKKLVAAAAAQVVLLTLRLIGAIDWPWWIVLSPAWITPAAFMVLTVALWLILCFGWRSD